MPMHLQTSRSLRQARLLAHLADRLPSSWSSEALLQKTSSLLRSSWRTSADLWRPSTADHSLNSRLSHRSSSSTSWLDHSSQTLPQASSADPSLFSEQLRSRHSRRRSGSLPASLESLQQTQARHIRSADLHQTSHCRRSVWSSSAQRTSSRSSSQICSARLPSRWKQSSSTVRQQERSRF